jgi:hypothetical protein
VDAQQRFDWGSVVAASLAAVLTKVLGTGAARYLASKFRKISERLIEYLTDFTIDTALSRPAVQANVRAVNNITSSKMKSEPNGKKTKK